MTIAESIISYVKEHPEATVDEIHNKIGGNKPSINVIITKLIQRNLIKRTTQGHYADINYISSDTKDKIDDKKKKSISSANHIPELEVLNLIKLQEKYGTLNLIKELELALKIAKKFK